MTILIYEEFENFIFNSNSNQLNIYVPKQYKALIKSNHNKDNKKIKYL